ncbi:MAG: phosphoribosylaminoimidazolesuccinocarboxamide synthase [Acidimicrobiaceae bacterium]|nr:phosphoribosylaminoimidazolesuccinocarboxamide synthase [Acidimicrobiaceae bacterium]
MQITEPCTDISLPLPDRKVGKVRVAYALPNNQRLFVTTDRLSAFDQIVAAVPYKGQVLNQLAAWWFANTKDIIANHIVSLPDPNATIALGATPLPVEVIVRGVMTGSTSTSIWKQYEQGNRKIYGYSFADNILKNTLLPEAIITPTTKGDAGAHDEPLTNAEVVKRGFVDANTWKTVQVSALALFARGQEVAKRAGLLLADTKYEFGTLPNGDVIIIDEMHTPDSSRFWELSSYQDRLAAGKEPESLDKEPIRLALDAIGYRGDGRPPELDGSVIAATTKRYIAAYERLTESAFAPGEYPIQPRLTLALQKAKIL